jgi:hypothetical protein
MLAMALETFFHNFAAMQHGLPLRLCDKSLCLGGIDKGGAPMDLTKSLNVVMFCAAFAFVSAIVLGLVS